MVKKATNFDVLVNLVLHEFVEPFPWVFSDDMDDWLASVGATTYTESHMEETAKRLKRQEVARDNLMLAGPDALPAVRKGLRHTKYLRGREVLMEFMKLHGGEVADKEVLRLIAVRRRDPLAKESRKLLALWGEDIGKLYPRPRSAPTQTEIEYEEKLVRLVEKCRQPTKVRDLMKELRLTDRRHFRRHYLVEISSIRELIEPSAYSGPLRDCYQITQKGIAWLEKRSLKT